jgi:CRP/FNR family transcriptional regulator, cyclic AMP receptor protein
MAVRRTKTVSVLDADRDLAGRLTAVALAAARHNAIASVFTLRPGELDPRSWGGIADGHLGFLVLSGLLTRSVTVLDRTSIELLGAEDLLRPWEEGAEDASVPREVSWSVLQSAQIAVLDQRFARRVARWPEIAAALLDRMFGRVQRLSFHVAILEHPRVEVRLVLLFWQLADRWGHMGPEGVTLPLRLTHQALGRLVRAQRPSVTASLRGLAERGLIQRDDAGFWLLRGNVSEHLGALAAGARAFRTGSLDRAGARRGRRDGRPVSGKVSSPLPPRLPDPG